MTTIDKVAKALVDEYFGVGWYDRQDDEFRRRWGFMARAAMEVMQEPAEADVCAAWGAQDLVPGRAYESIHFGTVKYLGLDNYMGETTHEFQVGRNGRRYWSTAKLDQFLKPKQTMGAAE